MPIDPKLLEEIRAQVATSASVRELAVQEAEAVVDGVQRRFIHNPSKVWWWESLAAEAQAIPYGDADALELLDEMIPTDQLVRLVVTDDEVGPWPVFEGKAKALWDLLGELRLFEYFVTNERFEWVVFDTHCNELVAVGVKDPGRSSKRFLHRKE